MPDTTELTSPDSSTDQGGAVRIYEGEHYAIHPAEPQHVDLRDGSQPTRTRPEPDLQRIQRQLAEQGVDVALPPPMRQSELPEPDVLEGTPLSEVVRQMRRED